MHAHIQEYHISRVEQGNGNNDGGANAELCFTLRFVAPHAARTKRSSGIAPFGRDPAPLVGRNDEPLITYSSDSPQPYILLCSLFNKPMFIISSKSGVPLNSALCKRVIHADNPQQG